jgi:parallel beta-helix repeat protein
MNFKVLLTMMAVAWYAAGCGMEPGAPELSVATCDSGACALSRPEMSGEAEAEAPSDSGNTIPGADQEAPSYEFDWPDQEAPPSLPICPVNTSDPELEETGQVVYIDEDCRLPANSDFYRVQFRINTSHVTVDCNGSRLHGLSPGQEPLPNYQPYPEGDEPTDSAFFIRTFEQDLRNGHRCHDIVVRDCFIENYHYGIDVRMYLTESTRQALQIVYDSGSAELAEALEDSLRYFAPQDISFVNMHIQGSHKSGMYLRPYVNNITFEDGSIRNSGSLAVYMDSGTQSNTISNSTFSGNGHYRWDSSQRMKIRRTGKKRREAIAVDASAYNTIVGNTFDDNAHGGIFLYKNCYEHAGDDNQNPRLQHSHDNLIELNVFTGEKYGVWIASRQSRDLSNWDCGDPLVHDTGIWPFKKKYYRDYAENTRVIENVFYDNETGVRVEDDHAEVRGNVFSGNDDAGISIGSWVRLATGDPVRGTVVEDNLFMTPSGRSIVHKHGCKDSEFAGNHTPDGPLYAPCTHPFHVPAQNAPDKHCRMENPVPGDSYPNYDVHFFHDTTREGYSQGVWGHGDFVCMNGEWFMTDGYCCYGSSCD